MILQEYVMNPRGVQLFTCGWLPASPSPKALVFLCHGTATAANQTPSLLSTTSSVCDSTIPNLAYFNALVASNSQICAVLKEYKQFCVLIDHFIYIDPFSFSSMCVHLLQGMEWNAVSS
jgi:hypothetical protein